MIKGADREAREINGLKPIDLVDADRDMDPQLKDQLLNLLR